MRTKTLHRWLAVALAFTLLGMAGFGPAAAAESTPWVIAAFVSMQLGIVITLVLLWKLRPR